MLEYKYAYLIGSLLALLIWIILFWRRKDLRREMLTLSLLTAALSPAELIYFGSYWRPEFIVNIFDLNIGIESILVCFAYGGVCGVVYEYFFRRKLIRKPNINMSVSKLTTLTCFLFGLIAIFFLESFTNLNTIYTTSTGLAVMGVLFIYFRPDLIRSALVSAVISILISILLYWILLIFFPSLFDKFWISEAITNVRILFIPIEEYYFHFALGLSLGIIYEVQFGLSSRHLPK